jgi:16S rRNA (cytosine967-C5)-methyltransferase
VAESTYEIVRWWRFFQQVSQDAPLTDRYARIFVAYLLYSNQEVPDWLAPDSKARHVIYESLQKTDWSRKIKESIPDWMDEWGERELGKAVWEKELHALNQQASVFLRVNTIKTSTEKLLSQLLEKQIHVVPLPKKKEGLLLQKRQNMASLEEYQKGLFEIQDKGSQEIAPFLQVQKGMRVIDACAGGGGKTLHLAALMQNQGHIHAMDVETKKLSNLRERAKRAGATIIHTDLINDQILLQHEGFADRLLLDVPCTGSGVLKRKPDTKWKSSLEEWAKIRDTQAHILDSYSSMLKKGGEMVYATCSLFPSENQGQIVRFLEKQGTNYSLLEERHIWPSEGGDGYYMARLRKNS